MMRQRMKTDRAKLSACLTCRLCNQFFKNATTISECLHTFCRECINRKLIVEKLKHCPTCNADLGCSPLDKLRTDNSLQDLKDKIFPSQGKTYEASNNVPALTLPTKRKKKSLLSFKAKARRKTPSSGEVSSPQEKLDSSSHKPEKEEDDKKDEKRGGIEILDQVSAVLSPRREKTAACRVATPQETCFSSSKPENVEAGGKKNEKPRGIGILDEVSTILSARKAKAAARKKFVPIESPPTCQSDKVTGGEKRDDHHSQLDTFCKTSKTRDQNSSKPDSSQQVVPNNISEDSAESCKESADMHEPLNCLVESVRKNKSHNKSTMQANAVLPVPVDSSDNDSQVPKVKVINNKHSHQNNAASVQNEWNHSKSDSTKLKRLLQNTQERKAKFSEDLNVPPQPETASNGESINRFGSIWFCLSATEEREAAKQLPQLSSCYIRIKDGSLLVSDIKKYLVKKLDLSNEDEVEISVRGQPVLPSLQLDDLMDMWLQTVPENERIPTFVGSSGKDFVMVVSYSRKA